MTGILASNCFFVSRDYYDMLWTRLSALRLVNSMFVELKVFRWDEKYSVMVLLLLEEY